MEWCSGLQAQDLKRVAVLDFARADSPGSFDPTLLDFSRAVQARLLEDKNYAWVERQDFDRIMTEADPGGARGIDAATAVRLGRLLRADLLLRGEVTQRSTGAAELTLEALDLKRAEVLATRTVPMAMNARQKLHPTTAEMMASTGAAQAALTEARGKLEQIKNLQVLAPLYFRNTSMSDRLGFLEERLQAALARASASAAGLRVLRFPRTGEAGEESSLVLAGLTDTDPDAWQKVADVYVWGSFKEEPVDGAAFENVPVTIVLQVSNGTSERRELQWKGTVKTLATGLDALAGQVIEASRVLAATNVPAKLNERQLIAADLRRRAGETGRQIAQGGAQFPASSTGRQLYAYRTRLLEVACFFDPLNRALQEERLQTVWGGQNPFKPLGTLRGQWLRVADYQAQAARFARQADNSLDGQWPAARAKNLRDFISMLEGAAWRAKELQVSGEEIHRQLRAIVREWGELLAETHRAVRQEPQTPQWYATLQTEWFAQANLLSTVRDPIIVHDALEKIWPVLEPQMGQLLKNDQSGKDGQSIRWIEAIFSAYGALGDQDRATAMLDSAWRLGRANQIRPAGEAEKPRSPHPPRVDRVWGPQQALRPTPPAPINPAFPELAANIREIDPRSIRTFIRARSMEGPMFEKNMTTTVGSLAWREGKLWISESNEPLPPALGPQNPQGNHYLWCYDPAVRTAELITSKLGGHSAVRTITPMAEGLWLGFDGDGVWRFDRGGTTQRYKGEDGLQTMQIQSAAADQRELFYSGGSSRGQLISSYSLKDGKWTGLQVPRFSPMLWRAAAQPGNVNMQESGLLAISGEWLCFGGPWTSFYSRSTKKWVDFRLGTETAGAFEGQYSIISADERGFWFAGGSFDTGVLWFVDPAKPEGKRWIRLPGGSPKAMAHWRSHLLIALEDGGGRSRLALVDKQAFTFVGQIALPMQQACSLAVGDGRAWVGGVKQPVNTGSWDGGFALVEVELPESGSAVPAVADQPRDFPLHRAAWAGDQTILAAALASKPELDVATASGWTALMSAAAAGRNDLLRLLLEAGANPNLLSSDGDSALQQAAARGDLESTSLLLKHGAQANIRPRVLLRGLSAPARLQLTPSTPGAETTTPPRQPGNLKAAVTADGEVALTWEDRADNEAYYQVLYKNSYGMKMVVAQLPANATKWIDPNTHDEAELIYLVKSINGFTDRDAVIPEVRIKRPAPTDNLIRSRDGLGVASPDILPVVFMAQSALSVAVINDRPECVDLLLSAGADPNQADAAGFTPLMQAVRYRRYTLARQLLARGARPELIAETGDSAALLTYQLHEDGELLEELLRASPPEDRAREATVLISEAADRGQIKDIEKLLALGGDLGDRIAVGDSPIRRALAANQVEAAQWMLTRRAPDLQRKFRSGKLPEGESEIVIAVISRNDPGLFGQLLDMGLGVDQFVGESPVLVVAAQKKAFAVLTMLRERGANLSLRSNSYEIGGRSDGTAAGYLTPEETQRYLGAGPAAGREITWPLPQSFNLSSPGPVQFVWQPELAKIEVNAALVEACQKGNLPAVMQAAAAGAELDCYGSEGRTPLLEALKAEAFDVVRWLVEEGASVNRPSKRGFSPVAFAVGSGKSSEVDYLLQAGGDPNLFGEGGLPPLAMAAQAGNLEILRQLLAAGANPNVSAYVNGRRENPLAIALWKAKVGVVDLLLANGANPRSQTYYFVGNTDVPGGVTKRPQPSLLMFAAAGRNLELVKKMISLGQEPRLRASGDYDALAWAADAGSREVVEFLLPLSAHKGRALESALGKGHTDIAQILEMAGYQSP